MTSAVEDTGRPVDQIRVTIGPQFLELFSEQLYTSPNRAFEELVSNSWDAGATAVHVGMSAALTAANAAVWVLDNGGSMDVAGFELLWAVATSNKPALRTARPQIGKFGIGKLATYVLAHQLTYICHAADGVTRAVTMDYRRIHEAGPDQLHIDPIPLTVRELTDDDVLALLDTVDRGELILELLTERLSDVESWEQSDEFGGPAPAVDTTGDTWTLALLTDLKSLGVGIQSGRIRRMLRTSLPLGSSVGLTFNGEKLASTKVDIGVIQAWQIGPGLAIEKVTDVEGAEFAVTEVESPYPHVRIEGLDGEVSGSVVLYTQSISGGKSLDLGYSNGFYVNILGRVINADDPYFGLENLNHTAWAMFRATVRCDGLNDQLSVNREGVQEGTSLEVLRAFLRALFNRARNVHDSMVRASWPDAGDVLTNSWGTVPLEPLRRAVQDGLESGQPPAFVRGFEPERLQDLRDSWPDTVSAELVSNVCFEGLGPDGPLVTYDLQEKAVVVNADHPFAREHGRTHEQQLLLRDSGVADLLGQAYLSQLGVDEAIVGQVELYHDQVLRLLARLRRTSGAQIAELLDLAAVHKKDKALEAILSDAIESLGYVVERLAQPGQPEGKATAPLTAGSKGSRAYAFTYDAKSTINKKVKTGNVGVAGLARHRSDHEADYALVVGPAFEEGALEKECEQNKVTPMVAADLGALVILNATRGPLNLAELEPLFELYSPKAVHEYIGKLAEELQDTSRLSYAALFDALASLSFEGPDMLTTPVIALRIRENTKNSGVPTKSDVAELLKGLAILAPAIVRVAGDNVFLGARPDVLREAVLKQVRALPPAYRYGVDRDMAAGT